MDEHHPTDADTRRMFLQVRRMYALAASQLPVMAAVLWMFAENPLLDDPVTAAALGAVLGVPALASLLLAPVVERAVRSGRRRRLLVFPLPEDPLRRYRAAKLARLAMSFDGASAGFVLALMIGDAVGYAAGLLALVVIAVGWPRTEQLAPVEVAAAPPPA